MSFNDSVQSVRSLRSTRMSLMPRSRITFVTYCGPPIIARILSAAVLSETPSIDSSNSRNVIVTGLPCALSRIEGELVGRDGDALIEFEFAGVDATHQCDRGRELEYASHREPLVAAFCDVLAGVEIQRRVANDAVERNE